MVFRKLICVVVLFFFLQGESFFAQDSIPSYIITTGKLPQLAYSSGEDRLGSAKMGYIDTSVVMKVIDTIKNLYKVQLSALHYAFIEKTYTQPFPDTMLSTALCESWRVKGGDESDSYRIDSVSFSLSGKAPYKSWMEINPSRIKIELYNVQSNINWITQLTSAKAVKNVWYEQIESDVLQITIELVKQQHYGYSIGYNGTSLLLKIRRLPASIRNMTIAIDAGHGGTNLGASGVTSGILEKNYTILFAKELQKILKKQKIKVLMVRETDTTIENKDRVLWAQQNNPDVFISFHLNSSGRSNVKGVSTYYKHIGYRSFSQSILKRLLEIKNLDEFGNVGSFNFTPIQPTDYPSCLVEVAFLSNEEDEKMILDPKFRYKVAYQVYLGIKDWIKEWK
ncbi:MAG TPA: N-acetylmuramoyl-L-alanine amidase [Chitinophagaceae bacterium]|nr:N-acetylmuramoyl-L-alanine amidase [Chitinophagaceae bacterium]